MAGEKGFLEEWLAVMVSVILVLVLLVFLKLDALSVLTGPVTATTADVSKTSGFLNNTALWAPGRNTEFSGTNQGFRAKRHNPHHHRQGFESPSFWVAPVDERDMNRLAEMQKESLSGFAAGRSVNEGMLVGSLSGR
jgi:hypothetical protein